MTLDKLSVKFSSFPSIVALVPLALVLLVAVQVPNRLRNPSSSSSLLFSLLLFSSLFFSSLLSSSLLFSPPKASGPYASLLFSLLLFSSLFFSSLFFSCQQKLFNFNGKNISCLRIFFHNDEPSPQQKKERKKERRREKEREKERAGQPSCVLREKEGRSTSCSATTLTWTLTSWRLWIA